MIDDLHAASTEHGLAERVCRRALDFTGGSWAALLLIDGGETGGISVAASLGLAALDAGLLAGIDEDDPLRGVIHDALSGPRRALVLEDAALTNIGLSQTLFPDGRLALCALPSPGGGSAGCLLVATMPRGALTSEHEHLLMALAEQAGIALHSIRLYAGSQRALRESETLRFIGRQLAGQVESHGLLNQLVHHARAILEADLVAVAATWPEAGSRHAAVGFESDLFRRHGYDASHAVAARAMAQGRPVVLDLDEWPEDAVLAAEGIEVACGVPLVSGREPFGALVAGYRRRTEVTAHQLSLAQALASYASVSLDNVRLIAQAEARAAEADAERRLLRAVLESLPVGIVIADADGTLLDVNPAAANLAATLRPGMPYADAFAALDPRHADGTPLSDESLPLERALLDGETVSGLELSARGPNGSRRPLLANAAPVPGADGRTRAAVLSLQDVSALKEVERLKDEFLSVASHELKTPLTPLLGLTQLLVRAAERGQIPPADQLAVNLRTIHRQALHMNELVNDLLDVSRIQQGRLDVFPEELDIIALAADVLERFESLQTSGTHRRLRLQTAAQSIPGRWDRRRLDQVITNLVSNAIKYSPAGSEVLLSAEADTEHVRVSVHDQGIGVPAAEQQRLFEPFYRATNASVRNYPGVGLGLHITREIVARHGGRILVESTEGKGSTFTVELPLAAGDVSGSERLE